MEKRNRKANTVTKLKGETGIACVNDNCPAFMVEKAA